MSELSDGIAGISAGLNGLVTLLGTVATDLKTEIDEINAKIAAGGVTQADLDGLKAINATVTGMTATVTQLDTDIKSVVP